MIKFDCKKVILIENQLKLPIFDKIDNFFNLLCLFSSKSGKFGHVLISFASTRSSEILESANNLIKILDVSMKKARAI